ncbi:MAG: tetratricopeptide repeat protein [Verrucomicrobiota bacterium]
MATTHRAFVSKNHDDSDFPPLLSLAVLRERGGKPVELGLFLIDTGCFGVKDAYFATMLPEEVDERLDELFEYGRVEKPAAWGRKFAESALAFRKSLGFAQPRDYKKAARVFGGIRTADCDEDFAFGKDGKPFYFQGPNDSDAEARRILEHLDRRLGPDGFLFMVQANTPYTDDLENQVQAFIDFAEEGLLKKARHGLEALLESHPDSAEVHFGFGCLHNFENDTERAAVAFGRSVELKPDHRASLYNYAVCQSQLGELGPAIRALRECLRLAPDADDALTQDAKEELTEIEQSVREHLNIEPDRFLQADHLIREAQEHVKTEQWEAAEPLFRQATELAPACDSYWAAYAMCLRKLERFDEAIAAIDRALELNPGNARAAYARRLIELESQGISLKQMVEALKQQ